MPKASDQNYDGVDVRAKTGKAKWNKFKWVLVFSNTVVRSACRNNFWC
jgi:hypothetical protein